MNPRTRGHIRRRVSVFDSSVDAISWESILGRISTWAARAESRYLCLCSLRSLLGGRHDPEFRYAVQASDTAAPSGALMAWLLRRRGVILQERIDGATLLWRYAERAAQDGTPLFFYGETNGKLRRLIENLRARFPRLRIAGCAPARNDDALARIAASGARVVFVALGAREEVWMARHCAEISAVFVGAGSFATQPPLSLLLKGWLDNGWLDTLTERWRALIRVATPAQVAYAPRATTDTESIGSKA